jgi:hypothetical protein
MIDLEGYCSVDLEGYCPVNLEGYCPVDLEGYNPYITKDRICVKDKAKCNGMLIAARKVKEDQTESRFHGCAQSNGEQQIRESKEVK